MVPDDDDNKVVSDLIEAGSSITGALAGAAVGVVGGPPGMVAGAVVGGGLSVGLKRIGKELRRRALGPREELRLGASLTYAVTAAKARLDRGEQLRTDGFFEVRHEPGDRSVADEVIEGVLTSAERDYEERKLALYGKLLAGIAFRADISHAHANYLIRTVRDLSYRQLCILALACRGTMGSAEFNGIANEDARWRPSAGVNDNGRRFLRRATNSRRETHTRVDTSITDRAHPRPD